MPPAPRWFLCARVRLSSPKRASSTAFQLLHIRFARQRWRSVFRKIVVDTSRRIIDHGDIITAGGFLSWVDLGLFLVDRIFGPAMWAETAALCSFRPSRG